MATDANTKTFMEDRESFHALLDCLPAPERALYDSMESRALEAGFPGRKLVAYTLQAGRPVDVETLTFGAMRMSAVGGPSIELRSDKHSQELTIGMVPLKLPGKALFIQVPQKFEFKWKGKRGGSGGVNFAPHYAVLIRSQSKPHLKADGDTFCVRLNEFRELFPDIKIGY